MRSFVNLFIRVLWQNRTFSILNIAGLAVGIASFILIVLWITDELSYDRYNKNGDRIVRVASYFALNGREGSTIYCPAPMARALRNDFPEVENTVRLRQYGNFIIQKDDIVFDERRIIFADSTFFRIFSVNLIKGNPDKVLVARQSITLSETTARKYFGDEDPIGQILKLDNRTDYEVTGIFEDMPSASHFHFDFIASLNTYDEANEDMWLSNNFMTYVLLKPNTDHDKFSEKMNSLIEKYVSVQAELALGMPWDKIIETGTKLGYSTHELYDIHLRSAYEGEFEPSGNITTVRIFGIIAAFIILIACINFTNLSTARSSTRIKEVGVRKTFGVTRVQLVRQFIVESIIIVFTALLVALAFVEISLPFFNELTGKELAINYLSGRYILGVVILILVISFMAGSYPSFFLSSFRPITVIRGEMNRQAGQINFRSILVIIQFFISLVLLSSTVILARQMRFIQKKELGFNREQVVVINNTYLMNDNIRSFRNEVLKNPAVMSTTVTGFLPIPSNRNNSSIFPDAILTENLFNCQNWTVDHDFIKTLGLTLVDGRDFSLDYPTDSLALILNESAVKGLGWDEPLGRFLGIPTDYSEIENMKLDRYTVIGVVKDFHYESMHTPIEPMVMFLGNSTSRVTIRLNANSDITALLKDVERLWNDFVPGQPFSYTFVDERLALMYQNEQKLGKLLGIFTLFAFFVSCLGLIGLALFASEQRRKEIGLRKVNGSGVGQIIWLLSTDFTKLILVSFILSVPLTTIFMSKWLSGFAYRTTIAWWIFALTGLLTYFIAMAAIIFQSYRAATTNPVDVFRAE